MYNFSYFVHYLPHFCIYPHIFKYFVGIICTVFVTFIEFLLKKYNCRSYLNLKIYKGICSMDQCYFPACLYLLYTNLVESAQKVEHL